MGCSLPSSKSRDRLPLPALPLRPQPAPRGSFHLDLEVRKLLLLVAGRDPGSDLSAWVSGSDLEMVSAFRETTLSLVVRDVEKGGATLAKQTFTLYCRTCGTPLAMMFTVTPLMSDS